MRAPAWLCVYLRPCRSVRHGVGGFFRREHHAVCRRERRRFLPEARVRVRPAGHKGDVLLPQVLGRCSWGASRCSRANCGRWRLKAGRRPPAVRFSIGRVLVTVLLPRAAVNGFGSPGPAPARAQLMCCLLRRGRATVLGRWRARRSGRRAANPCSSRGLPARESAETTSLQRAHADQPLSSRPRRNRRHSALIPTAARRCSQSFTVSSRH